MSENLHYESVYFKEVHNELEYYRPTIYRARAAGSVNYYRGGSILLWVYRRDNTLGMLGEHSKSL